MSSTPVYIAPTRPADASLVLAVGIAGGIFGLGWCAYFFYGQWQKALTCGILFIAAPVFILLLSVVTCGLGLILLPILVVLLVPLAIANVIDAHLQNQCLRQGYTIGPWTFFSQHY